MIELRKNQLVFSFPEVHPRAELRISFQRTLRIPDDDRDYPLPPGLGEFPLEHVDDYAGKVSSAWLQRGGVMLPMYQSEAMWLNFSSRKIPWNEVPYPFAVKVATGKMCAISGKEWCAGLRRDPQDYMVIPEQPWLDGYVVEKGFIRQFVAMPLGSGYSAEEQLTGRAEHGGLQLAVLPMKRKVFEQRFPRRERIHRAFRAKYDIDEIPCMKSISVADMSLSPGGRMRQEIYEDPYDCSDWQTGLTGRCFVHLCNSLVWQSITGSHPPHPAPTAKQYTETGLPWFDYYNDTKKAVSGSAELADLKSVGQLSDEKGDVALPENESVTPENLVVYRRGLRKEQVREGVF